jgi:two-component system, OmpR family, response regulator
MINILMIEDDPEFSEFLGEYLAKYNMKITNYEDPFLGLSVGISKFDILILDLTLPGIDGLEVCEKISKSYDIPIIISSARGDVTDKIMGLQIGADYYLPKPYDPKEMYAVIQSLLRRSKRVGKDGIVSREEIVSKCESLTDSYSKSLDVIIGRLRTKLDDNPRKPQYIHSIRGLGYELTQ